MIKTAITEPNAAQFVFKNEKTMYGGKKISRAIELRIGELYAVSTACDTELNDLSQLFNVHSIYDGIECEWQR